MKNIYKLFTCVILTSIIVGGNFFGKCNKTKTRTTTYSLALATSNAYTLTAYADFTLTTPITNTGRINAGQIVYILAKLKIQNASITSITGADKITDSTAMLIMNTNKAIAATYTVSADGFTYTPTMDTITGYTGTAKNIEIPATIKGNPVKVISGDSLLTSSNFPSTIKSVIIPEGITDIAASAFAQCGVLTDITLPNTLKSIGRSSLSSCGSLSRITLPNGLIRMYTNAFINSGLTAITIPNTMIEIQQGAFQYCTVLTDITLSNSLTTIGNLGPDPLVSLVVFLQIVVH